MDTTTPTLETLFDQLGLDSSQEGIERFTAEHRLPDGVKLIEAPFWSEQQANFLKEQMQIDAEWAPVVDDLNALLHDSPKP
ncbi:DUF2789 domain-containing protein [Pseudomonas mucidolens]|uniref:DUF2789 domain-containing protein n=1 Tax=Pseudomonas mucidolens TaxID=46679 RepID=A0A1H2MEV2_9PSED|nr:DUF2789 domain-containing protein [Pseudomonas mucidolens]SDU91787.1 Protein of unknown function [Pseudomonas mucidolens]SQH33992.1 Protein of uncharacterised function (DUF2789) [Pseudomonas mucidolens]